MPKTIKKDIIHADGIDIGIYTSDYENEYISLTDIAKKREGEYPGYVIQNWMRNRSTISFIGLWEILHNPSFNCLEFEAIKNEAGDNGFVMTPKRWIEVTGAKGIVSKQGRYAATYAHRDIAFEFASWISSEFKLYIIEDYQRLKKDENSRLSLNWNLNREIAKLNYRIHTDAIKDYLIPPELTPEQISYKYANEAELNQLLVLANMESYNAILIGQGKTMSERIVLLRELAVKQMETLSMVSMDGIKQLPGGDYEEE